MFRVDHMLISEGSRNPKSTAETTPKTPKTPKNDSWNRGVFLHRKYEDQKDIQVRWTHHHTNSVELKDA